MAHAATPSDDELIARAREGDHQAFRSLVERYEGKVAATVIGMMGRGAEADDVGQETFIRFYRSLDRFRGDAGLGTYLTRIAINESLKALKKRQRWTQRFFSRDDDRLVLPDPPADDESPLEEAERQRLLRQALDQLTPDHRAVVVLRMIEGHSTRETAAMLGIPEGTAMSRLKRAMSALQQNAKHLIGP